MDVGAGQGGSVSIYNPGPGSVDVVIDLQCYSLPFPAGVAGPPGPTGPSGPPGVTGPAGATGSTGATGLAEAFGPTGMAGPTGCVGMEPGTGIAFLSFAGQPCVIPIDPAWLASPPLTLLWRRQSVEQRWRGYLLSAALQYVQASVK